MQSPSERRLFVVTDSGRNQRKILMVRARNAEGGFDNHMEMTSRQLLEKVKGLETFGTSTELTCVSYHDPTLSFRLPDEIRPLELFPNLVISLGDVSSPAAPVLVFGSEAKLSVTFQDANGCLPNVSVEMPFVVTDQSETDIAKLVLDLTGGLTWEPLIEAAARQLSVSSDRVVLRHIADGCDYVFFPFASVGEDLQRFFKEENGKKVLKKGGDSASTDKADWDVYENITSATDLSFTMDVNNNWVADLAPTIKEDIDALGLGEVTINEVKIDWAFI